MASSITNTVSGHFVYQQRIRQEVHVSVYGVIFGSNPGIIAVIQLKICVATQSNLVAYIQTHKF